MLLFLFAADIVHAGAVQADPAAPKDPIVCSARGESPIGTKIPGKRRCVRKSQWDAEQAAAQRQLKEMQKYVPPSNSTPIPLVPSQ